MPLSSPPTAVASLDDTTLSAGISASATSLTLSPFFKTVNGVKTKQGLNSTAGIALIRANGYEERVSFTGSSVDSTTKVTTVTGLTRGMSVTSTTANFTGGTGCVWNKGARFTVVIDASYLQSGVFTNVINTFTVDQTFTGAVTMTGTTKALKPPAVTTAQRDAIASPANGMIVYNSTTGVMNQYISGAWTTFATGTTANAADATSGKVDIASATEIGAGTAVDATSGAINVIPVSQTVKTSSGAGDENKIAVLNSSGKLASGFMTADTNVVYPYGDGSDGALNVTSGTTTLDFASANVLIKNYSSINVSVGATLAVSNTPASGGLLVLLCTGTTTIAGTLDLKGKGSTGGAQVTVSVTSSTFSISNGTQGTEPFINAGQTRKGGAGIGAQNSGSPDAAASGGAGASSTPNSGANSTAATSGSATAALATAGSGLTAVLNTIASSVGLTVAPGAGGSTGGVAASVTGYGSGTASATSGPAGAGGGALLIGSKGNLSLTGTIDLRGNDATVSAVTSSSGNSATAAGASSGGAGGTGLAYTKGTMTSGGTYSVAAGAIGTKASAQTGAATAASTTAGISGAGAFIITKTIF